MTRHELNNLYFDWMYSLVCDNQYCEAESYRKLLYQLHCIEFIYTIPMDANRADDGIDLRYQFGYECDIDRPAIARYIDDRPCSMLEMLVALASRCETHIMYDPEIGDRTGLWFWSMIRNLGLGDMTDDNFDEELVDYTITNFLDHNYEPDGRGGLFTLKCFDRDLRGVEIWYQLNWYLNEFNEERS